MLWAMINLISRPNLYELGKLPLDHWAPSYTREDNCIGFYLGKEKYSFSVISHLVLVCPHLSGTLRSHSPVWLSMWGWLPIPPSYLQNLPNPTTVWGWGSAPSYSISLTNLPSAGCEWWLREQRRLMQHIFNV